MSPELAEQQQIDALIDTLNTAVESAFKSADKAQGVVEHSIRGPKGDPFTYEDFTEEQKAELVQGPILEAQTSVVNAVGTAK